MRDVTWVNATHFLLHSSAISPHPSNYTHLYSFFACGYERDSVSQPKASPLSKPTFSGTRWGGADVMSMSFCSGRPHSVRAPKRLPGELLRHRDSLIHKQTHKHTSLRSHTLPLHLNGSNYFCCPAEGPKSSLWQILPILDPVHIWFKAI